MFPLRDSIPSQRRPAVTLGIIVACSAVFLFELSLGPALQRFIEIWGFVPARLFVPSAYPGGLAMAVFTMFFAMFLHGGWFHIIGNMWFLWVFGDNVEDALGHAGYLSFYLVCGVAAALTQGIMAPGSTVPMVGASGAIAGVLGAYLLWYPWSKVKTLVFLGFFITFWEIPAPVFLLIWFAIQFFSGAVSLAETAAGGGVAFFAHVGGFLAGGAIAYILRRGGHIRPYPPTRILWE